jgi:hypothetical protein
MLIDLFLIFIVVILYHLSTFDSISLKSLITHDFICLSSFLVIYYDNRINIIDK